MLLDLLTTFCRVVDEGSFTKAAESLSLSQPTVTKQIQRLETLFNASLIERTQRELSLTEAGEVVYVYARRILNTLQKCYESLEDLKQPGYGELSISAVPVISLYTLPTLLEQFSSTNPLVTLHVRSGTNKEVINQVLHSDVDLGFTTIASTHPQLITRPLFEDKVLLIASPKTAKKFNFKLSASDLERIPMIAYDRRSQFRTFINSAFEAGGINPNIVMEFDSHEAVKTMVQLDLGIAMAPESAVRQDLLENRVVALQIEGFPALSRTTCMIMRRGRHQSQAFDAFVELVEALYPEGPLATSS